ncbi:helix-turn-helix domain-containing protein [Schlesneria paludicola]|uniref:helix-turn-helix domain-containing protein n=1 Tax=Schlesneria paludicola TaxID=360056 RepID=UPI00029B0C76|nr:AraC family transcriptional regulator [Schlesneria paludicola]
MAVLLENIQFASNENLRLLHWQASAKSLQSLEASGRRIPVAGVGGRWHSHPEMEFTIFQRGSGTRYVGDHVGTFGELDCVLLGGDLPHCWMEAERTDGYVLQFQLPAEHPLYRLGGAEELQRLFYSARRGIHYRFSIARRALVLLEAMATRSSLARAGLLLELLALLHDAPRSQTTLLSRGQIRVGVNEATRPCLEAVVQWMLEHFTKPIELEEAIKRSAMSRATFYRQFLKQTGKTFHTFLTDARLVHAHQLLTQSQRGIAEIAYASGFGSLTRFNAAFREKFAKSPREVRKCVDSALAGPRGSGA